MRTCEHCGLRFAAKANTKGRFCTSDCWYASIGVLGRLSRVWCRGRDGQSCRVAMTVAYAMAHDWRCVSCSVPSYRPVRAQTVVVDGVEYESVWDGREGLTSVGPLPGVRLPVVVPGTRPDIR